ncbi:MAG: type II secretion system protein GspK [Deltaproteobacteria bacterium]|nr:type II secretion system protein GspK [Deltaproteobacteria bacterium]
MNLWQTLRERHRNRHKRDRQSGVALLMTITSLTLLIAIISQFTYDSTISLAQAANGRDEVRAHYMARSAVNLSRMLIKIQTKFIDPIMANAQKMLGNSLGPGMGLSLRITDYAGAIMGFFGGTKEEAAGLGSLIGIDISQAKGLGMSQGTLDADISTEDGKINLNCGSGVSWNAQSQAILYQQLLGLMYSPRYNPLFEFPNAKGQIVERTEVATALIDWADGDEQRFSPMGSAGGEDYRYNASKDPYRAHDNSYDTVEEAAQVYGMGADLIEAFMPYLTVYANGDRQRQCKVNLKSVKGDCTPLLVGLIRASLLGDPTKPPTDPTVLDDRLIYPLASILCERGSVMGFDSLDTIISVLSNPAASISREDPRYQMMQGMRGITITKQDLDKVAYVGNPRVYRIVATGEVGKVKKKITAILDTQRDLFNPVSQNVMAEKAAGVYQFWREE